MSGTGTPQAGRADRLATWLDPMVKLAAVFAGVFAAYQYLAARTDARVARSLGYVDRYNDMSTPVGAAQARIEDTLWRHADTIRDLQSFDLDPVVAAEMKRAFTSNLLAGTGETSNLWQELTVVVRFFDALEICIDRDLCDEAAAMAFFSDPVVSTWGNFGEILKDRRDLDDNHAVGLDRLYARMTRKRRPRR